MKVRIVKCYDWLNIVVIICSVSVMTLLSYELRKIIFYPPVLPLFLFCMVLFAGIIILLLWFKIFISCGYAEFNELGVFIHCPPVFYEVKWKDVKLEDVKYNGDSINFYCFSIGAEGFIKIRGEVERKFLLHFASRAHYKVIESFIFINSHKEEYLSLYERCPYLYSSWQVFNNDC